MEGTVHGTDSLQAATDCINSNGEVCALMLLVCIRLHAPSKGVGDFLPISLL
jgi:hypothetical protein